MASDDPVQALVLSCLERVETLLDDLDRLATDPNRQHERERVQADMRRELEAAEAAIREHDARYGVSSPTPRSPRRD